MLRVGISGRASIKNCHFYREIRVPHIKFIVNWLAKVLLNKQWVLVERYLPKIQRKYCCIRITYSSDIHAHRECVCVPARVCALEKECVEIRKEEAAVNLPAVVPPPSSKNSKIKWIHGRLIRWKSDKKEGNLVQHTDFIEPINLNSIGLKLQTPNSICFHKWAVSTFWLLFTFTLRL